MPKRFLSLFLPAASLSAVVCLYFPAVVYQGNSQFIDSPFLYILMNLIPIGIALTALVGLIGYCLPKKWKLLYSKSVVSVSVLFWIIGTFLVFDRGLLDGSKPLRSDSSFYQYGELLALVGAYFLLLYLARKSPKWIGAAIFTLFLITASLVLMTIVGDKKRLRSPRNYDRFYELSSHKNVLVFLFDSFESSLFGEILAEEPTLADRMEGFTFFAKAVGVAPTTYLSMPVVNSGIEYSETLSVPQWYDLAIRKESFSAKLATAGYDSFLINKVGECPENSSCAFTDEMLEGSFRPILRDALFLLDISLYRGVPSRFKEYIYNNEKWFISQVFFGKTRAERDNQLIVEIGQKFHPTNNRPRMRFVRVVNTHAPIQVDAECKRLSGQKWNRVNAKNQAKCATRLFVNALDEFKKKNIYDNSLIVALADHGRYHPEDPRPRVLADARPLLMFKPYRKRGKLKISNANASLIDVAKSICQITKDCDCPNGIFVYDSQKLKSRSVIFNNYVWRKEYVYTKKVPITNRFLIDGPVDRILSWYETIPAGSLKSLHLNFNSNDSPKAYGMGWYTGKTDSSLQGRWVLGPYAQIYLPLRPGEKARLSFVVSTHPRNINQQMKLYIDKQLLGVAQIPIIQQKRFYFDIPASTVTTPVSRLTFMFGKYNKPTLGISKSLAALFHELEVNYDDLAVRE